MNFSDLFVVVASASALYGVIVALTRQRQFLAKAVNPHRATWMIAAVAMLWVGLSLLRLEAQTWNVSTLLGLVGQLVTEEPTPARVKIGSLAIFLGLVFLLLVGWCQFFMPRDPTTFRRPEDRRKAFKYYVTQLRGGLDYAMLGLGDGEVLEEVANAKQIASRAIHLPKVAVEETSAETLPAASTGTPIEPPAATPVQPPRIRSIDDQVRFWRKMAFTLHRRMAELDALISTAHQGHNRRISFDAEYGGFFFKYLRLPDPMSRVDTGQFLFGATLNQIELDSQTAEVHFRYLMEAVLFIEKGIRVS